MRYFKNSELIRLYNVSDKTVRNWIAAAQAGKLDLELFTTDANKVYIADTLNNGPALESLVQHGKKYRNQRSHQILIPLSEFSETFTVEQRLDIISDLDLRREIPLQYTFIGAEAAELWAKYANRLSVAPSPNTLQQTISLLASQTKYIDSMIATYKHVNVFDVTLGNGLPAKDFLAHIYATGKLRRYVGIDISQAMLDIAESNIHKWFGGSIRLEKQIKNIAQQRFLDIINHDSFGGDAADTINIVLFLGGTITNFRKPDQVLQNIHGSLGKNDLLITTTRLDSDRARRFFDYNVDSDKTAILSAQDRYLPRQLNINESLYKVEQFFDPQEKSRIFRLLLTKDISIKFEVGAFVKTIHLKKGERLTIFRARHYSPYELIELYRQNGLGLVQAVTSENQEYMLMVSRVISDITK